MRMARHDRWGAYIEDVKALGAVTRTQGLDGTDELEFDTTQDFAKGDRIALVDARGEAREYEVTALDASRSGGVPVTTVYAEDAVCELAGCWIDERQNTGYTAAQCLEKALDGTRWTAGTCDAGTLAETATTSWYHESVSDALEDICDVYGLELETSYGLDEAGTGIGARYVSLLEQRGDDGGKRFSYGKDLAGVRRTVASDRVVTRAYGYGAAVEYTDEETGDVSYGRRLDFADVNDGLEYVDADDDVLATWGMLGADGALCHVAGVYTNTECDDADQLLAETKAWLEEACEPSVTYEADVAALGLGEVGVGDVVRIVDTTFPTALRLEGRVTQIKEDLAGRSGTAEVTVGNVVASLSAAQQAYSQALASVQASASVANVAASAASSALSGTEAVKEAMEEAVDALNDEVDALVAEIEANYVKGEYLEENYYTKTETDEVISTELGTALYDSDGNAVYATASELTQTSSEILATIAATYVDADTLSSYATTSYVDQTASSITSEVASTYATQASLADYVTDEELSTALMGYVDGTTLTTTLEQYSTVEQTAEAITSAVETALYTTDEDGSQTAVYATASEVEQTAEYILSTVSETYLTADDAAGTYTTQSAVAQTAEEILAEVSTTYATNSALSDLADELDEVNDAAASAYSAATSVYGTCSTAASTAAKAVTCSGFALYTGASVTVSFTYANTAGAVTLNVNSTGALSVYVSGAAASTSNCILWAAGAEVRFVYDGAYWVYAGGATSYQVTCGTAAATAAKTASQTGAVVCKGTTVAVTWTYGNSYESGAVTFNLASTAAKTVYYGSAATSSSNTMPLASGATSTLTFGGQYWHAVSAYTSSVLVRESSDGVEVARVVGGSYTSTKALVDDEGFHVLSADGDELSSFEADRIELGKNSSDAVIEMCGGSGSIYCTDNVVRLGAKLSDDETAGGVYFTTYSTSSDGSELYESDAGFGMTDPLTFALTTLYTSVYYTQFETAALAAAFALIAGMQAGYATATASAGEHTAVTVDFGTTYSQRPYLSATLQHDSSTAFQWHVRSVGTDSFVMDVYNPNSSDCTVIINWVSFTR